MPVEKSGKGTREPAAVQMKCFGGKCSFWMCWKTGHRANVSSKLLTKEKHTEEYEEKIKEQKEAVAAREKANLREET